MQAEIVIKAACENYEILNEAKEILSSHEVDDFTLGKLIYEHHKRLRDSLGISSERIENILDKALSAGALGGKINGSGGGGCCFVYVHEKDCEQILDAVEKMGYPGKVLKIDTGLRVEEND